MKDHLVSGAEQRLERPLPAGLWWITARTAVVSARAEAAPETVVCTTGAGAQQFQVAPSLPDEV